MKKIILATLGMGLLAVGFNASAETTITTISPSLTVTGACTLNASAIGAVFPEQTSGATPALGLAMSSGNLKVTCLGESYVVAADGGNNAASNVRNLKAAGATLIPYKLTIDNGAGGAVIDWGDTGLSTVVGSGADSITDSVASFASGSAGGEDFIVTGVTTAALTGNEVAGSYTDTVTITVAW